MVNEPKIKGGATIWARQTIDSDIFNNKPDKWFKIWFYVVNRVSHEKTEKYECGECYVYYDWIIEKTGASKDQLKKFLVWARERNMVSTKRSTRGVWIKVPKYAYFQELSNYKTQPEAPEKHQRSTREALRYNKNVKNEKNKIIPSEQGSQVTEVFNIFCETINPNINYGNKTQRKAAEWLIGKYGLEKTIATAKYSCSVQGEKFAPTITTPYMLKEKMADLLVFNKRNKSSWAFIPNK